jgi:type I restriction enzyme, S subunit
MIADGYKDTEIGLIPVEWDVVKLIKYGKCIRGVSYKPKDVYEEDTDETVCILRSNNIKNNLLNYDEVVYVDRKTVKDNQLLQDNDIAICMSNGSKRLVGKNATFISNNKKVSIGAFCALFRTTNDNNPIFVKNLLSSNLYKKQIDILLAGSAINNLKNSDIEGLKFQLPPLKEQEKIADILSTADDKIDTITIQIEKAETLKKGLLQKLLSEGIGHSEFKDSELGKIPESWEVIPFLQLADTKISHSFTGGPFGSDLKSEHYTKDGVRVIQLQNIGDGSFINKDFVYTSEEKAEALKTCQIYPNDIILAKMAEPVARACIMPHIEEKYLMGSDGIRLHIDKSKYDTHFILHSINFNRFRNIAIARSTGTTRLRIGLTALKKIPIIIPPLEEQKQIADILSTTDEKLEVLRAKKEKYETLKKGLLQKLLSGLVRVKP